MISIRAVQVNIFALTLSSLYASAPNASAPDLGTKYQKDVVLICYTSTCASSSSASTHIYNIKWMQGKDNVFFLAKTNDDKKTPLDIELKSATDNNFGGNSVFNDPANRLTVQGHNSSREFVGTYIRSESAFKANIIINPQANDSISRGSALFLGGNNNGYALYGDIMMTLDKNTTLKAVIDHSIKGNISFEETRNGNVDANTSYMALDGLKNRAYNLVDLKDKQANVWLDFADGADIDGSISFMTNNNKQISSYQDKQIFNFGTTNASMNQIKGGVTSNFGNLVLNFKGDAGIKSLDFSKSATLNLTANNMVLQDGIKANDNAMISLHVADSLTINKSLDFSNSATLNLTANNMVLQDGIKANDNAMISLHIANSLTVDKNIEKGANAKIDIDVSNLQLNGLNNAISKLALSNNAQVSLNAHQGNNFQLLVLDELSIKGDASFSLYLNPKINNGTFGSTQMGNYGHIYSNRVIAKKFIKENSNAVINLKLKDLDTLMASLPSYKRGGTETEGNIAVFTIKNNNSQKQGASDISLDSSAGYDALAIELKAVHTDMYGKVVGGMDGDYTTYFLNNIKAVGIVDNPITQSVRSSLSFGYHLFLANLNSLNKRMGELRENSNANGLWARVFTGKLSTHFNTQDIINSYSYYTTLQTGYDYAFGFSGANNYLGFALSYANSVGKMIDRSSTQNYSNAVEFAIYNAYVQDGASNETHWKNGLYNDSIMKFSGIFNGLSNYNASFSNFGFSFSDELGYRFLLGNDNKWAITPQVELTFGYLNASNFTYKDNIGSFDASQNSIFMFRSRVGSSFEYAFSKFRDSQSYAKVYLGLYYSGDVINGGKVILSNPLVNNSSSYRVLGSTNRFVLNLGTNFSIKDHHRIYFDFERSFGGSIVTQYQFNLGYRYSFGKSKYSPYSTAKNFGSTQTTLKETPISPGYYIRLLSTSGLSNKQARIINQIENLKIGTIGNNKEYLVGPFDSKQKVVDIRNELKGLLKEMNSNGDIIHTKDSKTFIKVLFR